MEILMVVLSNFHQMLQPEYVQRLPRPLPRVGDTVYSNRIPYMVIARNNQELTHNYPRFRQQVGNVMIESFLWGPQRQRIFTIRSSSFPNPQEALGGMGRVQPTRPPENPQFGD